MFNTGDRRRCHTVNIVNDDDCEKPAEDFFSDLSSADGQLTINPNRTTVFIDDDNEPDCGKITDCGYVSHFSYFSFHLWLRVVLI